MKEKISSIQDQLKRLHLDGWLLYDFQNSNPIAWNFCQLTHDKNHLTRRWFYWIPREGEPIALLHVLEAEQFDHLPGQKRRYLKWQELQGELKAMLSGKAKIAMEYSPLAALPYLSKVDAGTVELVREASQGQVVSSAEFIGSFSSVWNETKFKSHLA